MTRFFELKLQIYLLKIAMQNSTFQIASTPLSFIQKSNFNKRKCKIKMFFLNCSPQTVYLYFLYCQLQKQISFRMKNTIQKTYKYFPFMTKVSLKIVYFKFLLKVLSHSHVMFIS